MIDFTDGNNVRAPDTARRNPAGYSPSIGSPSCCLIIAAFATDLAEKWLFV